MIPFPDGRNGGFDGLGGRMHPLRRDIRTSGGIEHHRASVVPGLFDNGRGRELQSVSVKVHRFTALQ